ncbi:hypothetical protein [Chitinophaga sp. 212800010-3]
MTWLFIDDDHASFRYCLPCLPMVGITSIPVFDGVTEAQKRLLT